jgi:hypothetical protein
MPADLVDARALFERTVSKLSPQSARPLFDRFFKYECEYGDTAAIRKLNKRMADLYPEGKLPLISTHPRITSNQIHASTYHIRHQPNCNP